MATVMALSEEERSELLRQAYVYTGIEQMFTEATLKTRRLVTAGAP